MLQGIADQQEGRKAFGPPVAKKRKCLKSTSSLETATQDCAKQELKDCKWHFSFFITKQSCDLLHTPTQGWTCLLSGLILHQPLPGCAATSSLSVMIHTAFSSPDIHGPTLTPGSAPPGQSIHPAVCPPHQSVPFPRSCCTLLPARSFPHYRPAKSIPHQPPPTETPSGTWPCCPAWSLPDSRYAILDLKVHLAEEDRRKYNGRNNTCPTHWP